jgi:hypothetical protein
MAFPVCNSIFLNLPICLTQNFAARLMRLKEIGYREREREMSQISHQPMAY